MDHPLKDIRALIEKTDWADPAFSWPKAYICARLSEFAYWIVPEDERTAGGSVAMVPCRAYREITQNRQTADYPALVAEAGLEEAFMDLNPSIRAFPQRSAVAFIIRTPWVAFLAIRGTKTLHDWRTNLQIRKTDVPYGEAVYRLHRGFYTAAQSLMDPILPALSRMRAEAPRVPLYVTGHSLGGALAGILHGLDTNDLPPTEDRAPSINPLVAYAFGMPRYGDPQTARTIRPPYHIYNPKDGVTNLPPCLFNYANAGMPFATTGSTAPRPDHCGLLSLAHIGLDLVLNAIIPGYDLLPNHQIETYVEKTRALAFPQG